MPDVIDVTTNRSLAPGIEPSTPKTEPPPELEQLLAEIEAEAPALASSPADLATDGATQPAAAPALAPSEPAFTPENFKEALQGFAMVLSMMSGIPDDVRERILSDKSCARLAVHGVPVLNKYDVKAGEWFVFWNRWRDEILLSIDLLAVTREGFREWKAWRIEELEKKANEEARKRGGRPSIVTKPGTPPARPQFSAGPITGPHVPPDSTEADDGTGELPVS